MIKRSRWPTVAMEAIVGGLALWPIIRAGSWAHGQINSVVRAIERGSAALVQISETVGREGEYDAPVR